MFSRAKFFALVPILLLCACSGGLPKGVDKDALMEQVGAAVGDSATCVVLAEAGTGKMIWKSSSVTICGVERQACTRPGMITVIARAEEAAKGQAVVAGCESVSWASGPTPREGVVYAAVMYGERALPGIEMARRLDEAFKAAGL